MFEGRFITEEDLETMRAMISRVSDKTTVIIAGELPSDKVSEDDEQ